MLLLLYGYGLIGIDILLRFQFVSYRLLYHFLLFRHHFDIIIIFFFYTFRSSFCFNAFWKTSNEAWGNFLMIFSSFFLLYFSSFIFSSALWFIYFVRFSMFSSCASSIYLCLFILFVLNLISFFFLIFYFRFLLHT